jgi:hypothetical protein
MTISKPIEQAPTVNDSLKVASETAAEEAEMELQQLLEQFDEWQKENLGGWKDFLKSNKDDIKVKRITLEDGGPVDYSENSYAQLLDDYSDNIQTIEIDGVKESFQSYVKRMGGIYNE